MTSDPLLDGLQLMLVGMGTVFVFLSALVLATTGMSRLVMRFAPPPQQAADLSADEVAAITAAIKLHRKRAE